MASEFERSITHVFHVFLVARDLRYRTRLTQIFSSEHGAYVLHLVSPGRDPNVLASLAIPQAHLLKKMHNTSHNREQIDRNDGKENFHPLVFGTMRWDRTE